MLYGTKTRLRLLEAADLKTVAKWRNKPEVAARFFSCWPIAISEQGRWYERYVTNARERMFIIETLEGKEVGTIALCNINLHHQAAEVGRVMLADEQDRVKGYMADALVTLMEFAFREANLNRLYVETFEDNEEALALYRKCGFTQEGLHRQAIWKGGRFRNVAVLSILREEVV